MRRKLLHRLGRDVRGASAVEFALIAPIILLLYVGMVQVCQAFMADKRAGHAAAIVGDMVAQNATMNPDQVDNVLAAGGRIMRPFTDANLTVRVTSVDQTSGTPKVAWSRTRGSTTALPPLSKGTEIDIPANYEIGGGPIVLTESRYDYVPLINLEGLKIPLPATFSHATYHQPRQATVNCANC